MKKKSKNSVLIVAATFIEVEPLFRLFKIRQKSSYEFLFKSGNSKIQILITGVGVPETLFFVTSQLSKKKPSLVINAGIAGAFNKSLAMGETFVVGSDYFAGIGADDKGQFRSIYELNLAKDSKFPYSKGKLITTDYKKYKTTHRVKPVSGVTVNTTSGSEKQIKKFRKLNPADVESMEGAAVLLPCLYLNVPVIQLRSVSNYIEKRDKTKWKIKESIASLNKLLAQLIEETGKMKP